MYESRRAATLAAALFALAAPAKAQKATPPPSHLPSTVSSAAVSLAPVLNRAALEVGARQAVTAEDLEFKATLRPEKPGPSLAGRSVAFSVDGAAACSGKTDAAGVATCHYKIPPMPQGFHTYEARFDGGGGLGSAKAQAKLLVGKAQTKMTVTAGPSAGLKPGDKISVVATLARALDGSAIDGKPVAFSVNGKPAGNQTAVNGLAALSWTVPPDASGPQKFEAFFATDDFYVGTSATVSKDLVAAPKKAYLAILQGGAGTVGKTLTVRGRISKVPFVPGMPSSSTGLSGRRLKFIFVGVDFQTNSVKPLWNWTATSDANGVATVSEVPQRSASRIRLRLEDPADGWTAEEVETAFTITPSETVLTAPPVSARIGTIATLTVHAARKSDGSPRKTARLHVTKFDGVPLQKAVDFGTNGSGDGTASIPIQSTMGIGNHTWTVVVEGDPSCQPATITVPLAVQPSA